jgi:hypothetical protein
VVQKIECSLHNVIAYKNMFCNNDHRPRHDVVVFKVQTFTDLKTYSKYSTVAMPNCLLSEKGI